MFKNLNHFKKNVKVGQKVKVINKLKNTCENRIIVSKQTNAISTGVEITEEEYQNSRSNSRNVIELDGKFYTCIYLDYQKAKEMKFENNHISFLACERKFSLNTVAIMPSNEFKVGDTWLELIFEE